jgi:hypothetical protein
VASMPGPRTSTASSKTTSCGSIFRYWPVSRDILGANFRITNFLRFSTIFDEQIDVFIENQGYDPFWA